MPPSQVVTGLALILTLYVMAPTGERMYGAVKPVLGMAAGADLTSGQTIEALEQASLRAKEPLRAFLLNFELTGSIVPSGRFLVGKMIAPVPASYYGQIIELGTHAVRTCMLGLRGLERGDVSCEAQRQSQPRDRPHCSLPSLVHDTHPVANAEVIR